MDSYVRAIELDNRKAARLVWLAGLSAIVGFGVISPLFSVMFTIVAWMGVRSKPELQRENGRKALNWQLSYLLYHAALIPLHLAAVGAERSGASAFPWSAVTFCSLIALFVLNLVFSIAGAVAGGRGRVFDPRIAIPFIPRRRR